MKGTLRNLFMTGSALAAFGGLEAPVAAQLAAATPLPGASSGRAGGREIEDIVVTARRVSESLQKVPTSIGVVSADVLQNRQIQSVSDLRQSVANLTVAKTPVAGGNILTIRGVTGQAIPNVSVDSSIGIYIDGVYLGRPQASGAAIADIARVEVLRGPQGTLFGRNSSGGAINFVTTAPGDTFGVQADALYGNYDQKRGRVSIDTGDRGGFAGRVTYFHEDYDGDVRNRSGGAVFNFDSGVGSVKNLSRLGGRNTDAIVAKLRFDGIDGFKADYKYDWVDQKEVSIQGQLFGFAPGQAGQSYAGLFLLQAPGNISIGTSRLNSLNLDFAGVATVRASGHLLTLEKELGDSTTIKSISAYREVKTRSSQDSDGGAYRLPLGPPAPAGTTIPLALSGSVNVQKQHQVTQELQLLGNYDSFSYILGGFYFREKGLSDLTRFAGKALVPGASGNIAVVPGDLFTGQRERATNISYAAYGHADYHFTEQLDLAAGARYTIDKREGIDARTMPAIGAKVKFKRFNYDAALTYAPTSDVNVYARYATGYQSGGIIRLVAFSPEDAKSIEAGIKSEFFDRRLRFNAAIYHQKITDQQSAGFDPLVGLVVRNIGRVKIDGFEIETTAKPVDGLTLTANFGLNDPKASTGDANRAPKKTFAFSAQYDAPEFANGMFVSVQGDGDYRSKYTAIGATLPASRVASTTFRLPPALYAGFPNEQAYLDDLFRRSALGGYWQFNARISLNDIPIQGGTFRVSGFVRNITNNAGILYSVNAGALAGVFERPRTYGVELGMKF